MFEKGDKVLYGETGVCLIENICEKEFIKNQKKMYYILKPVLSNGNVIYAPIDNDRIPIRKIISQSKAEELIKNIPSIAENTQDNTEFNFDDYKNEILSHDPKKFVELIVRISKRKKSVLLQKKRLNSIEEKYMKIAENLLFGELSEALQVDFNEVQACVLQMI